MPPFIDKIHGEKKFVIEKYLTQLLNYSKENSTSEVYRDWLNQTLSNNGTNEKHESYHDRYQDWYVLYLRQMRDSYTKY